MLDLNLASHLMRVKDILIPDEMPRQARHDGMKGEMPRQARHDGMKGEMPRQVRHDGMKGEMPRQARQDGRQGLANSMTAFNCSDLIDR